MSSRPDVKHPGMGRGFRPMDRSNCLGCGHAMRSNRKPASAAPGTRKHVGRGLCSRCYTQEGRYSITRQEFDSMLIAQSGRCASCNDPMTGGKDPAIDHCHTTGKVRALLCNLCNVAEGMLLGDPRRARALADYMEQHTNTD